MPLGSVDVAPLQPQRFAEVLTGESFAQFEETIAAARALLGSVSGDLVRDAGCPVVITPRSAVVAHRGVTVPAQPVSA